MVLEEGSAAPAAEVERSAICAVSVAAVDRGAAPLAGGALAADVFAAAGATWVTTATPAIIDAPADAPSAGLVGATAGSIPEDPETSFPLAAVVTDALDGSRGPGVPAFAFPDCEAFVDSIARRSSGTDVPASALFEAGDLSSVRSVSGSGAVGVPMIFPTSDWIAASPTCAGSEAGLSGTAGGVGAFTSVRDTVAFALFGGALALGRSPRSVRRPPKFWPAAVAADESGSAPERARWSGTLASAATALGVTGSVP